MLGGEERFESLDLCLHVIEAHQLVELLLRGPFVRVNGRRLQACPLGTTSEVFRLHSRAVEDLEPNPQRPVVETGRTVGEELEEPVLQPSLFRAAPLVAVELPHAFRELVLAEAIALRINPVQSLVAQLRA